MRKICIAAICLSIALSCFTVTAFASDNGIMPCYNNALRTDSNFKILNEVANVKTGYTGISGITTGAKVTVVLQKRSLLVFWNDVTTWVDNSTNYMDSFTHTYAVSSGTYRVKITYEISGSGGATDVIEKTIKASN